MKKRFYTASLILKKKLHEDFFNFGFSMSLTIGLFIGGLFVGGFIRSISILGLSSFDPNPLYKIFIILLELVFGKLYVYRIFSNGPFLLSLILSFIPVIIFLSIRSNKIFYITYIIKPILSESVDIKIMLIISLIKRIILSVIALIVIWLYYLCFVFLNNISVNSWFLSFIFVLIFFSISVYSIQTFISVFIRRIYLSILVFLLSLFFFTFIQISLQVLVHLKTLPLLVSITSIISWISPVYYLYRGLSSNLSDVLLSIVLQSIFSILLVALSFLIIKMRGIKA